MFDGLRKGSWYFVIDNNTSMSIFAWEEYYSLMILILLSDGVSINIFFWTPFLFFSFRLFYLPIFYLSTRSTSFLSLESSGSFHLVSKFLAISCPFSGWMNEFLWMLFTVSKVKFTLSKTLIMYIAYDTWPNKGEYLNILKSIFLALFLAHNHVEVKAYYK